MIAMQMEARRNQTLREIVSYLRALETRPISTDVLCDLVAIKHFAANIAEQRVVQTHVQPSECKSSVLPRGYDHPMHSGFGRTEVVPAYDDPNG